MGIAAILSEGLSTLSQAVGMAEGIVLTALTDVALSAYLRMLQFPVIQCLLLPFPHYPRQALHGNSEQIYLQAKHSSTRKKHKYALLKIA